MRIRPVLVLMLIAGLGAGAFAAAVDSSVRRSAVVRFERPTWVAAAMLLGSYVIVHDDEKMARGQPCTAIYRLGSDRRPGSEIVAFHCIPRYRPAGRTFSVTIDSSMVQGADTLTEYQFAGDPEAHGVPLISQVATSPDAELESPCTH